MSLLRLSTVALLAVTILACTGKSTVDSQRHSPADTGAADARDTGGNVDSGDGGAGEVDGTDAGQDVDRTSEDASTGDAESEDATPDARPGRGTDIGTFWNTYYYLAAESGYEGADDTTLYDHECDPIAEVPADFADDACIEGSARLEDGTVINYHSPCSCGPCSFCWAEMDPTTHPWGMGSRGNALEPLRSWAVDTDVLAHGTVVYVEEWDGVDIPRVDELGGFVHDGCFRADDVGGGIEGNHFDFFAGTPAMWQALEAVYPTRTDFTVYVDSPRCDHL